MAIISEVGRKSSKVRFLITGIYIILILGSITMVYPFLLMLSTSITSDIDQNEFKAIPAYIYNEKALYLKFLHNKYNWELKYFNDKYGTSYMDWKKDVKIPDFTKDKRNIKKITDDYEEFLKTLSPNHYTVYYMGKKLPGKVEKLYHNFLKEKYKENIDKLNKDYLEENENFHTVYVPFEQHLDPFWMPENTKKEKDFLKFKKALSPRFRQIIYGSGIYREFLRGKYKEIEELNKIWKKEYKSFSEITLTETIPENLAERKDYEEFIRYNFPMRYIYIKDGFAGINRTIPEDKYEQKEWIKFVREKLPLEYLKLQSADILYQKFLKNEYKNISSLNKEYETNYSDFTNIQPPFKEYDFIDFKKNKKEIYWDFIIRNYREVIGYIMLRGRSLWNTLLLCVLTIITQLTVNPICAYALSRYKMPYTYKILLFLLATMAFPAEVAMIPNFLLLKQFHMLNTFWALFIPGMANGFFIFLLKGFFDSLPEELYEAAILDGASEMYMFRKIAVPLSKPIFAVIALTSFTAAYGSFMWALIVCQDPKMWTLMVYLYQFSQSATPYMMMAALTLASLPTLFVFIFCQNIILKGLILPQAK